MHLYILYIFYIFHGFLALLQHQKWKQFEKFVFKKLPQISPSAATKVQQLIINKSRNKTATTINKQSENSWTVEQFLLWPPLTAFFWHSGKMCPNYNYNVREREREGSANFCFFWDLKIVQHLPFLKCFLLFSSSSSSLIIDKLSIIKCVAP